MRGVAAVLMLGVLGSDVATAAEYPTRHITVIVPFSPGGSTDVQARLITKGLSERLGVPVIVENRPGGGGSLGAKVAASAAPDGYTLLFGSTSSLASEPVLRAKQPIDVLRDFAPITQITDMPFMFVVAQSSPIKTLAELVAEMRKRPGDATYASWGTGSVGHILGEMFKLSARVDGLHVPYKGEALAITDVIAGHVMMSFCTPVNLPHVRGGKLRVLAVTGDKRFAPLPDVPTFLESGLRGIDLPMWFGFVTQAKTPPEIVARLHKEIGAVLKTPEFVRAADNLGLTVIGNSPSEFSQRIRTDAGLVGELRTKANLNLAD
jgi:tripartite-type tricarboxylate transporter receptor subunit TctC